MLITLLACGAGDNKSTVPTAPETTQPAQLTLTSGGGTGEAGSPLPTPVAVRVDDSRGRPLAGVAVSWKVGQGEGSVSGAVTLSDATGRASVVWTLGPRSGVQSLTATVGALPPVSVTATATPGPLTALTVTPDTVTLVPNQTAFATLRGADRFGNPVMLGVAGTQVGWASSDAAIVAVSADGIVRALAPGAAQVRATAGALSTITRVVVAVPPRVDVPGTVRGTVQIPASVAPASVYVTNHEGAAVPTAADGSFTVDASADLATELFAKSGDRLVGIALVPPSAAPSTAGALASRQAGEARGVREARMGARAAPRGTRGNTARITATASVSVVSIDAQSTALALIAAAPPFGAVPAAAAESLLTQLRAVPAVRDFGDVIRRATLQTGALPDGSDPAFTAAYRHAVASALDALGGAPALAARNVMTPGGQFGLSAASAAVAGITLVPNSGVQFRGCKSGAVADLPCVFRNVLQRHVDLHLVPAADDGTPLVDPASTPGHQLDPDTWFCNVLEPNCWYKAFHGDIDFGGDGSDVPIHIAFKPGRARYQVYAYGLGREDSNISTPLSPAERDLVRYQSAQTIVEFFVLPAISKAIGFAIPQAKSAGYNNAVAFLEQGKWVSAVTDCVMYSTGGALSGGACVATEMLDKLSSNDALLKAFATGILQSQGKSAAQVAAALNNMKDDLKYASGLLKVIDYESSAAEFYQTIEPLLYGVKRQVSSVQIAQILGVDHLEYHTGRSQTGAVGSTLPTRLTLVVRDKDDQPLSGVFIHWVADPGSGSPEAEYVTTGAGGVASTAWTLGPTAGTQRMTAVVDGTESASLRSVFTATAQALPGPPAPPGPSGSPPTVTGFNPSAPTASASKQDQTVTVQGTGFQPGLTVSVGFPGGGGATLSGAQISGVTASSFTILINFNGVGGSYTIRVNNPSGQSSNTATLVVSAPAGPGAPTVTGFSPATPQASKGDQPVTVQGTGFLPGLTVSVGFPGGGGTTLSGSQISAVTSNSFVMLMDFNGNAGSYTIRVNNPGSQSSNPATLVVAPPPAASAPTISGFSPSSPQATVGNQSVTVQGTGFLPGLNVTVGFPGGASATLSGAQINGVTSTSFTMLIDFNGNPGSYTIRVNNPGGQSSTPATLVAVAPPVATPTITGFSPSSPQATKGNQSVVVQGTGFVPGLTVGVGFPGGGGGTLSGAQITGVTPTSFTMLVDFNGNAGTYSIRVTNPGGQPSAAASLVVSPPPTPAPTITGFSPASPQATKGNQTVVVQGTGFQGPLTVSVGFPGGGGATLSGSQIISVTSTSLVMLIDFNGIAGAYTIRVNNSGGQSSNPATLTVTPPPAASPTVTGFSPSSPQATKGNQAVTVQGTGFQAGLTVSVGFPGGGGTTLSGTQITSVTASSFTMLIDFNGNAGSYSIRVNNPGGQSSNTTTLAVAPPSAAAPTITGFAPSVPQATKGNQTVVVQGSGFQSGLTVTVGFPGGGSATLGGTQISGVTATSFSMLIDFNGNAGAYSIRVNNPGGQSSNTVSLTASAPPTPAPTLTVSPPSGTQKTTFTTSGSNYTPGGLVNRFVAQPGQSFAQITALPASGAGTISWSFTGTCAQLVGTVQIYAVDATTGRQSPIITEQVAKDPSCP